MLHQPRPSDLLLALSPELAQMCAGASITPVTIGYSGAAVDRLEWPDRPPQYLKRKPYALHEPLAWERDRLLWLGAYLPVPQVVCFAADAVQEFLLLTAIPGQMACDLALAGEVAAVVRLLAAGLRQWHALPVDACPFDERLAVKLARARDRLAAGLVDEDDFDVERRGRAAADLYTELLALRPPAEDLVVTHGDYCLPNIFVRNGQVSGFIDVGRCGVTDRYQDLALAARSLAHNWGPAWVPQLYEAYGLPEPDQDKLAFYRMLDEFF